jgi:excisionase family DNA binding protein
MKQTTLKSFDELPLVLTVRDVSAVMGISRVGAYDLVRSDGFPTIRIGRRIAVPKAEFIKWLENTSRGR